MCVCMCAHVHIHVTTHTFGGKRSAWKREFSSTNCVGPGNQLSGLVFLSDLCVFSSVLPGYVTFLWCSLIGSCLSGLILLCERLDPHVPSECMHNHQQLIWGQKKCLFVGNLLNVTLSERHSGKTVCKPTWESVLSGSCLPWSVHPLCFFQEAVFQELFL